MLIYKNVSDVDQALYYFIDATKLRLLVMDSLDNVTAHRLRNMRPVPNNVALISTTSSMNSLIESVRAIILIFLEF